MLFLFHVDEHCEMRCDKPEPWYENLNHVVVLVSSLSRCEMKGGGWGGCWIHLNAVITPMVTGNDTMNTEQIRGI